MHEKAHRFFDYYIEAIQNYVNFSDRTSRKEYSMFVLTDLVIIIIFCIFQFLMTDTYDHVLTTVYFVFMILPRISINVRRLHDMDKSGWWYFIYAVPVLRIILFIVLLLKKGTEGPNRFG